MRNMPITLLAIIGFPIGMILLSAVYFGAIFFGLNYLNIGSVSDRMAGNVGSDTGSVALLSGILLGVLLAFDVIWRRLAGPDGKPDRTARAVGTVLGVILLLFAFYVGAGPTLSTLAKYKAAGFIAFAGMLGIGGWISRRIGGRF
ncbi:MAG: hypothetical protein AB7R90_13160 [Reyranellaceae bacterium]